MYTLLSLNAYGYFPTIIGVCVIIFNYILFRENWKFNTIILCGYLILWFINFKYSGGYDIDAMLSNPTSTELISNTLTWLTIYLLLRKTQLRQLHILIPFIPFLFFSLFLGLFGLDCLLYDVFGVYFIIIMFIYYKKNSKIQAFIFLLSYLILAFLIFKIIPQVNWKFINKDYRSSEIVYLYWKHLTPDDYYLCTNIEDTELRFRQIYEVLRVKSTDSTIIFLEDPEAAFSFKRGTVRVSWDYDGVSYYGARWYLNKRDTLLVGNIDYYKPNDVIFKPDEIIYKPVSDVFNYYTPDNMDIIVNGKFDNLSLGLLFALQKYLKQEIPDLTNHKISLYNRNNEFKLGIQYFENDEYMLYLDKSFLKDSNMNNY